MRKHLSKRGFTLIEVLIVVVIIGILAALILPRLLAQPERAIISEGVQYLGVIRRAQQVYADSYGGGGYLDVAEIEPGDTGAAIPGEWRTLGLQALPESARFSYQCDAAAANCTATRDDPSGGVYNGSTIEIDLNDGTFDCAGRYQASTTSPATCIAT